MPSSHTWVGALGAGPSGAWMDFRAEARGGDGMVKEGGAILRNVCSVVQGGVVAFFASYAYLKLVMQGWEKAGILAAIRTKKEVFVEPGEGSQVDKVLGEYT